MSKKFLVITSFLSLVGLIFQFFLTGSLGFVRGIVDILFLGIVFTVV